MDYEQGLANSCGRCSLAAKGDDVPGRHPFPIVDDLRFDDDIWRKPHSVLGHHSGIGFHDHHTAGQRIVWIRVVNDGRKGHGRKGGGDLRP